MSTMISEVYTAFKAAGVTEQEARQAAEALSAENLATRNIIAEDKRDVIASITALRQEISGQIDRVWQAISGVRQEVSDLRQENSSTRQDLSSEIASVRQEVSGVRQENSSTRQDLSSEIASVRQEVAEVKRELGEFRQEITTEVAGIRLEMTREIAGVRLEIAGVRQEMTRESGEIKRGMGIMQWMLGLVLIVLVLPILRDIAAQISTG